MRRNAWVLLCAAAVIACSDSTPSAQKTAEPSKIDPATVATITARVTYKGEVPAPKAIAMSSAPQCALSHEGPVYDQSVMVKDGRLQNAIVYIEKGLEQLTFAPPTEAVEVDQKGCLYDPRVAVAMVGQPVDFLNSDTEAHNVHGFPSVVAGWNFILSRKGAKRTVTFDQPEMGVKVGCDIHPWMRGYVGITAHPFAAVTAADGSASLKGIPPGNYTIAVWHETLGTQRNEVTLPPNGALDVEFVYGG